MLARVREELEDLAGGNVLAQELEAFLTRERAAQQPTDPARCAERLLLGRPGCADAPASLSLTDVIDCARRLFARGAPIALVLGPGGSSARSE